jgi:hypothetical protein
MVFEQRRYGIEDERINVFKQYLCQNKEEYLKSSSHIKNSFDTYCEALKVLAGGRLRKRKRKQHKTRKHKKTRKASKRS